MKQLIVIITVLLFGLTSCSDESQLTSQDVSSDQLSLEKKDKDKNADPFSITKTIDGKKGGDISLKVSMEESTGTKSEIKLKFPKKSFEGKVEITVSLVPGSPVIELLPHGLVFEKELKMDVKLENFWFGEEDQLDFAYLDDNGDILEEVDYESLSFNYNKNYIKVKKAKINHFSRYGFTR